MRDIKFRVFLHNRMCYNKEIKFYDGCITTPEILEDIHIENNLMQYTGLKDKNGTEIYEGDLVKDEDENDIIPVEHSIYSMAGYSPFSDEVGPSGEDVEVVGNIYENPELLEE